MEVHDEHEKEDEIENGEESDNEEEVEKEEEEEGGEEGEGGEDVWDAFRARILERRGLDVTKKNLPILKNDLSNEYKNEVFELERLRRDPIHKKIMTTKRKFEEDDEYDSDEALEAAIESTKYLMYRECGFREEDIASGDDEDDDDDDDEEED